MLIHYQNVVIHVYIILYIILVCFVCISNKAYCPKCPNILVTKSTLRKDPYL